MKYGYLIAVLLIVLFVPSCAGTSYKDERTFGSKSAPRRPAPQEDADKAMQKEKGAAAAPSKTESGAPSEAEARIEEKPYDTGEDKAHPKEGIDESLKGLSYVAPEPKVEKFEIQELKDEAELEEQQLGGGGAGGGRGAQADEKALLEKIVEKEKLPEGVEKPEQDLISPSAANLMRREKKDSEEEKAKKEAELSEFRVRSQFPEILYFRSNEKTDENGLYKFSFNSGDSISSFDISAVASTTNGKWGRGKTSFGTFKDVFVDFDPPRKLHVSDEVLLKAAIFNYSKNAQNLQISVEAGKTLELDKDYKRTVNIETSKVIDFEFKIKAINHGRSKIKISAIGEKIKDEIEREIYIYPSKSEVRFSETGILTEGQNEIKISIPDNAVIRDDWVKEASMSTGNNLVLSTSDIWLRLYVDPSLGAVNLAKSLYDSPHASLVRTAAFIESGLLTDKILEEKKLTYGLSTFFVPIELESAMGRLLAFRSINGFALYPGDKPEVTADVLALNELRNLEAKMIIDKDIARSLEQNISRQISYGSFSIEDRLYMALIVLRSGNPSRELKNKIISLLDHADEIRNNDLLSLCLSYRIADLMGLTSLKTSLSDKVKSAIINAKPDEYKKKGLVVKTHGDGYALALLSASEAGFSTLIENDENLQNRILKNLLKIAWDDKSGPLEKSDALKAIYNFGLDKKTERILKSISVNGKKLSLYDLMPRTLTSEFSYQPFQKEPMIMEIPLALKPGENRILIEPEIEGIFYSLAGRYFSDAPPAKSDISVDLKIPEKPENPDFFHADLSITTSEDIVDKWWIIRIPIPPGVKPVDNPKALARRVTADYAEISQTEIVFYFNKAPRKGKTKYLIPMFSEIRGNFYLPSPSVESDTRGIELTYGTGQFIKWL